MDALCSASGRRPRAPASAQPATALRPSRQDAPGSAEWGGDGRPMPSYRPCNAFLSVHGMRF
eukprot:110794-Chlamydomonas_euryale.AAC.1